jgi:hypothetical protein
MLRIASAAALAALLLLVPAAPAGPPAQPTIPLPDEFRPEGIASGPKASFYVGSIPQGAVFRGSYVTGDGEVLVPPHPGRNHTGLKVDARHDLLFVAGGASKGIYVYDSRTGADVASFAIPDAGFVNDVVLTKRAAYFTDSQRNQLYVLDLGRRGELPESARTLPLTGDILSAPTTGFRLNGIEAAGERLIAVHSGAASLFAIDPRDGDTELIELEGGDVANGDGLLLHGRTLYVVQNRLNRIAVIRLDRDLDEGVITGHLTDSDFDVPTTIAEKGGFLWAVNARFNTPPTPDTEYDVVKVRR